MRNIFFFIAAFIFLLGCGGDNKQKLNKLTYINDCESLDGWDNNNRLLSTENFHSGRYSNILNTNNNYSITFSKKYGDISKKKLKGVKVSCWAYFLTNNFKGKVLVLNLDSAEKKVFYNQTFMDKFVKSPRTWTKIEEEIPLSRKFGPNTIFGFYAWSTSDDTILVDDLCIEFIED